MSNRWPAPLRAPVGPDQIKFWNVQLPPRGANLRQTLRPLWQRRGELIRPDTRRWLEARAGRESLEVSLGLLGLGVAVDPGPELGRVTGLEQVGELVHQDVVDDPARHLLEPVAEPDGPITWRAGPPALFL